MINHWTHFDVNAHITNRKLISTRNKSKCLLQCKYTIANSKSPQKLYILIFSNSNRTTKGIARLPIPSVYQFTLDLFDLSHRMPEWLKRSTSTRFSLAKLGISPHCCWGSNFSKQQTNDSSSQFRIYHFKWDIGIWVSINDMYISFYNYCHNFHRKQLLPFIGRHKSAFCSALWPTVMIRQTILDSLK